MEVAFVVPVPVLEVIEKLAVSVPVEWETEDMARFFRSEGGMPPSRHVPHTKGTNKPQHQAGDLFMVCVQNVDRKT